MTSCTSLALALAACLVLGACRSAPPPPAQSVPADPEACLDEVLRRAGLNRFGDPPDRMYAGGSPLFDERTGESTPRRAYVNARHPELVAQCPEPVK